MERNDLPSSGGTQQPNAGGTSGQGSSIGDGARESSDRGFADRARDIAGSAQDKLADVGSTVRDRTGHMKDSLADALDAGADKLRQRGMSMQSGQGDLAGATSSGSMAVESDGRMVQVTNKVAGGMSATADFLRNADLDNIRLGVERQVKEHPGRTLLIAVGVGYLLGKAIRK